jgi:hypothetical protein
MYRICQCIIEEMGLAIGMIMFCFLTFTGRKHNSVFLKKSDVPLSFVQETKWTSSTKPYLIVRIFSNLKY